MYVGGVNETHQICGKFSLKVFTFIFLPESFEMLPGEEGQLSRIFY